jgi:hypothetical protein
MRFFAILALAALSLSACGTPSQVRFETDGLHYESGPLAVRFRDPARFAFLQGSWRIENWVLKGSDELTRRYGDGFEGDLLIDLNGNGRAERCPGFFTDIELRNLETEGAIWAFMRELPEFRRNVSIDVLLDGYVDGFTYEVRSRTGALDFWGVSRTTTRSYAARILSREQVKFGPYDAVMATIETANLEQMKLDPQSRAGYLRILVARIPGFQTNLMSQSMLFPHSGVGILTVGFFDGPAYFKKGLPDFEAFLGQFTANGQPIAIVRAQPAP